MNDMEIYAIAICVAFIIVAVLFAWLFGQSDCCGDCEQGRRCRCQRESKP